MGAQELLQIVELLLILLRLPYIIEEDWIRHVIIITPLNAFLRLPYHGRARGRQDNEVLYTSTGCALVCRPIRTDSLAKQ